MTQGVKKKGLIVITAIIILIALVWFFVVDWAVKIAIESQGTKAVGARVDLAKADLSLIPAGIELTKLEVTNPDDPMTNALVVHRIFSDIELMPLIKGKVIIDNLRMEGIRVNTPRKTSGAVASGKASAGGNKPALPPWLNNACDSKETLGLAIPNVADILAREPLKSIGMAKDFEIRLKNVKTQWQQRLAELPSQKDLEAYRAQLKKIKGTGGIAALMTSATELTAMAEKLRKDLGKLKTAQQDYQKELDGLKQESAQLMKAPAEEARRLKAKYSVSPEGAAHLSRLLFGPSICEYWEKGYYWYERFKPYLGGATSGQGEKKPQPAQPQPNNGGLPDFLIRKVHVDALLDTGSFTGEVEDITSQPQILDKPLTFKFLGSQMKEIQKIGLNGVLNFIQPDDPRHHVQMLVQNYSLKDMNLGDPKELPLTIAKALANINLNLDLAGPKLDALIKARLDDVQVALQKAAGSELSKALADAISSVTQFGLTAIVEGMAPDYQTKIQSDLDGILRRAVGQIINKAGARLESQLQSAIAEKTKEPLNQVRSQLGGMGDLSSEITQRLNFGENLLKEIKLPF